MDCFQFDETRYDPTRPVRRISFLDIADRKNREYLKIYIKYQLGVTGISVQNIWARTYITKAFLRFLDQEKLAVDRLTAAEQVSMNQNFDYPGSYSFGADEEQFWMITTGLENRSKEQSEKKDVYYVTSCKSGSPY